MLSGIPSAPKGVPKIEVSFDINADGILNVTAKDLDGYYKEQKITITGSNMTTKEEIKRAREVAEEV